VKKKKQYIRQPLNNISELHRAQERIRIARKKLEKDMLLSVLGFPVYALVSNRRFKNKKNRSQGTRPAQAKSFIARLLSFAGKPLVAYFLGSWFRWQLFNLAFFVGKKLVYRIQKKQNNS